MNEPTKYALPSLDGATGWLNSAPLTPDDLRGKVVLVDFWTYTCINWLRTLGYVRAWAEKYESHGLVVIGVHTPEFPFEHDIDNVRWAAKELRRRVSDRARPRLCGVARVRQPLLARGLLRRRRRTDPAPPVRRRRVRGVRTDHPDVVAQKWSRRHCRRSRVRRRRRLRGASGLGEPGVARDLPRLRASSELRAWCCA